MDDIGLLCSSGIQGTFCTAIEKLCDCSLEASFVYICELFYDLCDTGDQEFYHWQSSRWGQWNFPTCVSWSHSDASFEMCLLITIADQLRLAFWFCGCTLQCVCCASNMISLQVTTELWLWVHCINCWVGLTKTVLVLFGGLSHGDLEVLG